VCVRVRAGARVCVCVCLCVVCVLCMCCACVCVYFLRERARACVLRARAWVTHADELYHPFTPYAFWIAEELAQTLLYNTRAHREVQVTCGW